MSDNIYEFGKNSNINKAARILGSYKEGDEILKAIEGVDISKAKNYPELLQKVYERQGRNPDGSLKVEDDFEKAEGSRGGKVIGHTKSGKPIYENAKSDHESYKHFSKEDHMDAADAHYNHMNKEGADGSTKLHGKHSLESHLKAAEHGDYSKKDDVKKALDIIGLTSEEDDSKKKI